MHLGCQYDLSRLKNKIDISLISIIIANFANNYFIDITLYGIRDR